MFESLRNLARNAMRIISRQKPPQMGRVEIKAYYDEPGTERHGKLAWSTGWNTITVDAKLTMAKAIAGDANGVIESVAWGTGVTPQQQSDPQASWGNVVEQYVLSTLIVKPATYVNSNSVIFTSMMPPGTGTGYSFSEVGLVSHEGKLFARFTFPGQPKFDRLRLSVNWQIIFA